MADVVQQGRDAQEFLHIVDRGHVGELRCQEWVQMSSEASRDMHGSQRMDEPTMLGGRIDPSGALQLKHIAQPLNPGRIDQIFFRAFSRIRRRIGDGERNVFVNRIGDQSRSIVENLWNVGLSFHGWSSDGNGILSQDRHVGNCSSSFVRCMR